MAKQPNIGRVISVQPLETEDARAGEMRLRQALQFTGMLVSYCVCCHEWNIVCV